MYSVLLVLNDYNERNILKDIISSISESITIYEADSGSSAINILSHTNIDMFLIDINLNKSSGLNLALKIREIPKYEFKNILIISEEVEHIIKAFKEVHCYDYILKPYSEKYISNTLKKLISKDVYNIQDNQEIIINSNSGEYICISIKDIIFIEVRGKNCYINTKRKIYEYKNLSLKKIIDLINCNDIIQSHRAFAINKKYVNKIEKIDSKLWRIYFEEYEETAFLGYKFKDQFISKFKKGRVVI